MSLEIVSEAREKINIIERKLTRKSAHHSKYLSNVQYELKEIIFLNFL